MVSSAFWSVVFSILGNLLRGSPFICCDHFFLYSCILSKIVGYSSLLCNRCVCFIICPSVTCCFSHTFHLCCCYSSCVSCFNGPIFTTVKHSWKSGVLYNSILFVFRVFCCLNVLFIIPVIFNYYYFFNIAGNFNWYKCVRIRESDRQGITYGTDENCKQNF